MPLSSALIDPRWLVWRRAADPADSCSGTVPADLCKHFQKGMIGDGRTFAELCRGVQNPAKSVASGGNGPAVAPARSILAGWGGKSAAPGLAPARGRDLDGAWTPPAANQLAPRPLALA